MGMSKRKRLTAAVVGTFSLVAACTSGSGYSKPAPKTLDRWAVGDSFATGVGPEAPGWGTALEAELGQPIATFGLGGATYADIYQWLQQEVHLYGYPLRLVVMAGANDLNSDVPMTYMQQNAASISSLMIARNVDVRFVTVPPAHPNSSWAKNNDDRVAFNNWLINSPMPAMDCSTPLQDGTWIKEEYVYAGDYSHLSPAGVEVLVDCISANL
jgi:lysophospholipase L1-like esterase